MSPNCASIGGAIRVGSMRCIAPLALLSIFAAPAIASAGTLCVNHGGTSGCKSTIGAAVAAATTGETITVWPGTYPEQVVITKSVSLVSKSNLQATIDAKGHSNGIFINGMSKAPNAGVSNVVISGFKVENANFEGILVVNASNVTLIENLVSDNNRSLEIAAGKCPGIPAFETNEGDDCGEGIHLIGVDHSSIIRNESSYNSGGLLISDETGMSFDNVISDNNVHDNPYDCGITMASHGPATTVIPSAKVSFGVVHNTVAHNMSWHNGYQVPGAGAGVGIFAPFPGTTSTGNVVINNDLRNNGMPGVAMHNHASAPAPAPPVNLNDNVIIGNHFSGNGADAADSATSGPTGINIYSTTMITGTVIDQNQFDTEAIDVAFKAPSGMLSVHLNDFSTGIGIDNMGAATVDATENWWNCAGGPGASECSTGKGSGISWSPWSTFAFAAE